MRQFRSDSRFACRIVHQTRPERKMTSRAVLLLAAVLVLAALVSEHRVESRYLPTRANGDRIDKLRELLKDLLESELDKEESDPQKWRPDGKYFVKREAQPKSKEVQAQ